MLSIRGEGSVNLVHLQRSIASSLFNLRVCQSFSITYFQILFGLPLGLEPSIHFFTQSLSFFRNTCPYHHNLRAVVSVFLSISVQSIQFCSFCFYCIVSVLINNTFIHSFIQTVSETDWRRRTKTIFVNLGRSGMKHGSR